MERLRIEWRESPEQSKASLALAEGWRGRAALFYAALFVCAGILLIVRFGERAACFAAVLALVSAAFARRSWMSRGARADERHRRWIDEARSAKRSDGFREPAPSPEPRLGEVLRYVELDADGVLVSSPGVRERRARWAGVRRIEMLRGGHVLFRGRTTVRDLLVPAWAFEAEEQLRMFVERARELHRVADRHPAPPDEAPPLEPRSENEITLELEYALAPLHAYYRAAPYPLVARAFLSICAGVVLGLAYAIAPPAFGEIVGWPYALGAVLSAVVFVTSARGQALLTLSLARHHVLTRARFSEIGLSFASALASSVRSWKDVKLTRSGPATLIDGFSVPDAWLDAEQVAALAAWKGAATEGAPEAPAPDRAGCAYLVAATLVLAVLAAAIVWVTRDDGGDREASWPPAVEQAAAEEPPPPEVETGICSLETSAVPGTPLRSSPCDELTRRMTDSSGSVLACAALDDPSVLEAATVLHSEGIDLWLRRDGEWRRNDALLRWNEEPVLNCEATFGATSIQLRAGGSEELLVTMDCSLPNDDASLRKRRYLSACSVDEPRCWWTIPIAEVAPDEYACLGFAYDVRSWARQPSPDLPPALRGQAIDPLLRMQLNEEEQAKAEARGGRRDDRLVLTLHSYAIVPSSYAQPGTFTLDELVQYSVLNVTEVPPLP